MLKVNYCNLWILSSRKKNGHDCTKIKCLKIGVIKKRKKTVKIVHLNLSMFLNENQWLKYSDDSCQRKLSLKVQFNHIKYRTRHYVYSKNIELK